MFLRNISRNFFIASILLIKHASSIHQTKNYTPLFIVDVMIERKCNIFWGCSYEKFDTSIFKFFWSTLLIIFFETLSLGGNISLYKGLSEQHINFSIPFLLLQKLRILGSKKSRYFGKMEIFAYFRKSPNFLNMWNEKMEKFPFEWYISSVCVD